MTRRRLSAFTLIELIVVMAIIVTLSVIGFISYNSYIRDARNATRQSQLDEAVAGIDRFIFNNARAPKCRGSAGVIAGAAVCYLTPDTGTGVGTAAKATGAKTYPTSPVAYNGYLPCSGTGCGGAVSGTLTYYGIDSADWTTLNLKKNPEDPRNVYFLYATDGGTAYAIFATKEESTGYSTMIRGYKALSFVDETDANDAVRAGLNFGAAGTLKSVIGLDVTSNAFTTTPRTIFGDGNIKAVPYSW